MTFWDKIRKKFLKLNLAQQISVGVLIVCIPLTVTLSVFAINNSASAMAALNEKENMPDTTITETTPSPSPTAETTPTPSPSPTPEAEPVEIFLKPSSVEEDLEVHIVDEDGNMVTGYPFLLTVVAKDGSYNKQWTVDDGFLRLTKISSGEYTVTIEDAEGYIIEENTIECTVEKKVEYEKIDVSDKVVDESEIDVKQEDAALSKPVEAPAATPALATYKDQIAITKTTAGIYKYKAEIEIGDFAESNVGYIEGSDKYVAKLDSNGYIVEIRLAPAKASPAAVAATDVSMLLNQAVRDSDLLKTYGRNSYNIVPLTLNDYDIMQVENVDSTPAPTEEPAATPTAEPTVAPTATPTPEPTAEPTATPTPTPEPTAEPTATPTAAPTAEPTATPAPSSSPSAAPTATPSPDPSAAPTATPTVSPSPSPSVQPTATPRPNFDSLAKATDIYDNDKGKLKNDFIKANGITDESIPEKISYFNGWKDKNKEYYYDAKGNPIKGQAIIGGITYTFDNNGKRISESNIAKGIDVSKWQGNIDWKKVKASGIDYAIIRVGYRGYGSGALVEDPYFRQNIEGATKAGLKVGVYFFSQAITTAEAVEEASMAINAVKGYKLHYPIYFDTELATTNSTGRADNLGSGQRTDIANAFCQTVRNSGYKAGVYASKSWFQYRVNYSTLSKYDIWLAHYTTATDFAHRYDMWQYTGTGSCPGVSGSVDLNWAYKVY
ncbi:MAG: hypothetical protein IJN27_07965 [Oscillospiraceae bacterium]|nr:hypothetical protein [Oscillospiraceae bacterium]